MESLPGSLASTLTSLQAFPELAANDMELQDAGNDNHIAILHNGGGRRTVVKTPRQDIGLGPGYVLAEALTVAHLRQAASIDPAPVEIPEVIESQQQVLPYYSVFSYVPGAILSKEDLYAVSDQNKVTVGKQLAEAVFWIEQQRTPEAVPEIFRSGLTPPHTRRLDYLRTFIDQYEALSSAGHQAIAEAMAVTVGRADELFTPGYLQGNAAGHSDLYYGNMTFDVTSEGISLKGIFDFGAMSVRPTESELRHFHFLSPWYTEGFVTKYQELSGVELDVEKIALWSMVQALGPLLYRITEGIELSEGEGHEWSHKHLLKEFYPRFCGEVGV